MKRKKVPILSKEKQYELMYNDSVLVLTDRKRAIFDLTKWIVTLHTLLIGFVSIKSGTLGPYFLGAPLIVGMAGLLLNRSIQMEMRSHRIAMAKLRKNVGGHFESIHQEMVDHFTSHNLKLFTYWNLISTSHAFIILSSTIISFYVVFTFIDLS